MATAKRRTNSPEHSFVMCRAMGHEWHHSDPIGSIDPNGRWRPPFGETGMIGYPSRCSVCTTERMRWIGRSGATVLRYEHPDGYSRTGEDRLSPQEYREAFVAEAFARFAAALEPTRKRSAS